MTDGRSFGRDTQSLAFRSVVLGSIIFFVVQGCSTGPVPSAAAMDKYLSSRTDEGYGFSVLVSVEGKIILERGYGRTDSAKRCRATARTLFNLASITKSLTAAAVLQLVEQKKLKLDDPLSAFFTEVPADKTAITVHELLAHTSGLAQNYAADGIGEREPAVRAILNDALKFRPGTDFSYSNENYELLAAVIEVVSGESYESYIRDHILTPSGMSDTRFWDEIKAFDDCRVAPPARPLDSTVFGRNWGYIGSGGIYSNVVDLNRFFLALLGGRVLSPASVALLWTTHWKTSATGIAYGWYLSQTLGASEIWTRGSEDWGHNGVLRWFPERKALVIVQSNSGERGDKNIIANRLLSDAIVSKLFDEHHED